jgi:hypothetical protein
MSYTIPPKLYNTNSKHWRRGHTTDITILARRGLIAWMQKKNYGTDVIDDGGRLHHGE